MKNREIKFTIIDKSTNEWVENSYEIPLKMFKLMDPQFIENVVMRLEDDIDKHIEEKRCSLLAPLEDYLQCLEEAGQDLSDWSDLSVAIAAFYAEYE